MVFETIKEILRKDGTKIVYEYNPETLRMWATIVATENMPDGITPGYACRWAELDNVLPDDITAFCRINKKLGLYQKVA